ncbi:hypothetical protein [Halalkalibacter akibai]|nr:hypothetical protein [Halalkalibacter akibai]
MKQLYDNMKTYCSQFFNLLFILEYEDLHQEQNVKSNAQEASLLNKS